MRNDDISQVCYNCGREPYLDDITKTRIPLRKCGRCMAAFYHDATCQRQHYKKHKKECLLISNKVKELSESVLAQVSVGSSKVNYYPDPRHLVDPTTSLPKRPLGSLYEIQARVDGEKGLFAVQDIDMNASYQTSLFFHPFVPPVINSEFRSKNCTMCFIPIRPGSGITLSRHPKYPVILCSKLCQDACHHWLPKEIEMVLKILTANEHVIILPLALMVYRILLLGSLDTLMTWKSHPILDGPTCDSENTHRMAVAAIIQYFALESPSIIQRALDYTANGQYDILSEDFITDILQRIKFNSFTLETPNREFLGTAIFTEPSNRINHSCDQNARQLLILGRPGHSPSLRIEICRSISKGEEVCIGYIRPELPIERRRMLLSEFYRFHCNCTRCLEEEKGMTIDLKN